MDAAVASAAKSGHPELQSRISKPDLPKPELPGALQ
jgi:hypothetical protein